jgi:hypothetical protein
MYHFRNWSRFKKYKHVWYVSWRRSSVVDMLYSLLRERFCQNLPVRRAQRISRNDQEGKMFCIFCFWVICGMSLHSVWACHCNPTFYALPSSSHALVNSPVYYMLPSSCKIWSAVVPFSRSCRTSLRFQQACIEGSNLLISQVSFVCPWAFLWVWWVCPFVCGLVSWLLYDPVPNWPPPNFF